MDPNRRLALTLAIVSAGSGRFMSLKPAIFASGSGRVRFRSLSYRALSPTPAS